MRACLFTVTRASVVVLAMALGAGATLAAGQGCGGTIIEAQPGEGGGGGDGTTGVTSTTSSGIPKPDFDAGEDAFEEYVDPGCGDPEPPETNFDCNPYDQQNSGCFSGEGCYIYVIYPDEACEQETYGALCAPEGPGGQGAVCGGANDCAAGFACVITGSGNQCVQLCPLQGASECPPGLVCEPIDVEGFGGCL